MQAQTTKNDQIISNDRILIVSGGGAAGAWGAGLCTALSKKYNGNYKVALGTSTGGLIAPFIINQKYDELKEGYTNINSDKIFKVNPFRIDGEKKGEVRPVLALWRILAKYKTLGDSRNLRTTIRELFSPEDYQAIKDHPEQDVLVTVVNVLQDTVEYKSLSKLTETYEDFTNWMWASANFPVFMSLYKKRDANNQKQYYVDGGIKESIPLRKALEIARERDIYNIDVVIHSTDKPIPKQIEKMNITTLLGQTIDIFRSEVRQNDIDIQNLKTLEVYVNQKLSTDEQNLQKTRVNFYFMSKEDTEKIKNQLVFEKDVMNGLWEEGYKAGQNQHEDCVVNFEFYNRDLDNNLLIQKLCPLKKEQLDYASKQKNTKGQ